MEVFWNSSTVIGSLRWSVDSQFLFLKMLIFMFRKHVFYFVDFYFGTSVGFYLIIIYCEDTLSGK
jgi:hypothetical protein